MFQMLEVSANMELKGNEEQAVDMDFCGISFEELLAQEKKDSFWQVVNLLLRNSCYFGWSVSNFSFIVPCRQKNGKLRTSASWKIFINRKFCIACCIISSSNLFRLHPRLSFSCMGSWIYWGEENISLNSLEMVTLYCSVKKHGLFLHVMLGEFSAC